MVSDSVVHAVAGAGGGMLAMAVTYPLVNISTRAQVETKKPEHANESALKTVQRIIKSEGIFALFDGLESSLIGIGITNFAFYQAFEESRAIILRAKAGTQTSKSAHTLSTLESILASLIAGCVTAVVSNPIWTINTQQMVQASLSDPDVAEASVTTKIDPKTGEKIIVRKLGFLQTIRKMYAKDGLAAFFRGLGPALVLCINPIIAYTSFEQLKNLIIARRGLRAARLPGRATDKPSVLPLTDLDNFLLGAFCKLLATGSLYPYLVVKSRLQAGAASGKRYRNSFHGLAVIFREEGLGALYSGIASKLAQSMLTAAFLFASKERLYLAAKAALRATAAKA